VCVNDFTDEKYVGKQYASSSSPASECKTVQKKFEKRVIAVIGRSSFVSPRDRELDEQNGGVA